MTEWKIQGSRVYGKGHSYNCTNKITAQQLYSTLNEYEKTITLHKNTEQKLDNITKGIIAIQMDLSNVQDTVNTLKKELQICESK